MFRIALVAGSVVVLAALVGVSQSLRASTAPRRIATDAAPPAAPVAAAKAPAPPRPAPPSFLEREDEVAFPALPKPGPSDWLSVHEEHGQTFDEFRRGRRRPLRPDRRTIRLLALDDVSKAGIDPAVLIEHLAAYYGVPVERLEPTEIGTFTTRLHPRTGLEQTLTTDVLDWLEGRIPRDAYGVIAVTQRDLYPDPTWNFVYGEASLSGGAGVFSFARMDDTFPAAPAPETRTEAQRVVVLRRCLKIVTHEVGHMFGIAHCLHGRCLMNGCNHVDEMDRAPLHLCVECLHKVSFATGVEVLPRYRALEALYRRIGLAPEADWVAGRVGRLASDTPSR